MSDENLYEYAVIRYVPRVEREEFINVGLLMMCKRRKWLRAMVSPCFERIDMFDPIHTRGEIDTALSLFCIVAEARKHRHPAADWPVEERFRWLTAVKSSCVSTSRPHPGFAEDLDSEFDRLYKELVI